MAPQHTDAFFRVWRRLSDRPDYAFLTACELQDIQGGWLRPDRPPPRLTCFRFCNRATPGLDGGRYNGKARRWMARTPYGDAIGSAGRRNKTANLPCNHAALRKTDPHIDDEACRWVEHQRWGSMFAPGRWPLVGPIDCLRLLSSGQLSVALPSLHFLDCFPFSPFKAVPIIFSFS